jgi:hypothetical protein
MASFTTRIELDDVKLGDYYTLDDEMHRRGFTRTIKGSDAVYKMPEATYNFVGDIAEQAVYDKAVQAVAALGRTGGIVVTKSAGRVIGGLHKVA